MREKKRYFSIAVLFITILLLLPSQVFGQSDFLEKPQNFNSLSKHEQVKILEKLCWKNREKQSDSALKYGLEGIKIAKAEGFDKELASLYNYVGVVYQDYLYNIPKAMTYYDKGLPLSLKVNDSVEIAYVFNNLGDAFYKVGNIPLAYEYARKSLKMFENLNNVRGIAYSYINLGEVNRINKKYDTALYYFRKALVLREAFDDSVGIASTNLEIAQTLFLNGETDSAMFYFRQSLEQHVQIHNMNYMAYSLQGMGDVFLTKNELDSAYVCFVKALKYSQKRQNPTSEINSKLGMAKVFCLQGKEKEGEKVLDEALVIAINSKLPPNILKVYKAKGTFYHTLGEFHKSSDNYQNYIHTYDSLFTVLQFQTLSEVKVRFSMMEKLNSVNQDLKSKQRDQIYAAVIILLLIVFSIVLFFRNRIIARLSSELLKSNQSKDKIFSIISHDLVSPFNVLLGASELLMEDIEAKDFDGAKEKGLLVQQTSEETFYFISNLLNWSRSQQKNIHLNQEVFDISELMKKVKSTLSNQAKVKNIKVSIHAPAELNVKADKNLIQIVLVNLLNNALKFTKIDGAINLSIEKQNDQVRVSVQDNGTGISPERLSQLFKGQSVDSLPGTNNERGTGLGLMLCKEFIEMHNSEIHVNSKEGEGSEFWFMLPLA